MGALTATLNVLSRSIDARAHGVDILAEELAVDDFEVANRIDRAYR